MSHLRPWNRWIVLRSTAPAILAARRRELERLQRRAHRRDLALDAALERRHEPAQQLVLRRAHGPSP